MSLSFQKPLAEDDSKEYRLREKYQEIITIKNKGLGIDFDDLKNGYQLRIITNNAINAIVMLDAVLAKYKLEEVYICVYRMNLRSVDWIKRNLYDSGVKSRVLLSNFFRENKRYEKWFEQIYLLNSKNFSVHTGCLHAKIFCCKTTCGRHIVFEGSGNLSDNARIEQYIIEDNENVYNFHANWMDEYR